MPCCRSSTFSFLHCESLRPSAACASPRAAAAIEEATHTSRAALRPGTAAVVKTSAGLDCEAVGPLGFVAMPKSRERTRSVLSRLRHCCRFLHVPTVGLGGNRSIDTARHPPKVVERQDTSRARVQVVEPFVGDLRLAQVFDSCHLLQDTSGEECSSDACVESDQVTESCAWSCGALSRLFRGAEKSVSSLSSS